MTEYQKALRYVELSDRIAQLQEKQDELQYKDPLLYDRITLSQICGTTSVMMLMDYPEIKVAMMDAIKDVLTKEEEKAIKELKEIKIDGTQES